MASIKTIKKISNTSFPLILGGGILYWMYRDFDFAALNGDYLHKMSWGWMLFSLVFGVLAQVFRGIRWKMTLKPLGENPSMTNCIHSIFLSYASSLVIPRSGEITRCAVLNKYDGTSFPKALGTVVTERIIDSLLILAITAIVILSQMTIFDSFFEQTGTNLTDTLKGFTYTGYIVTAICAVSTIGFLIFALKKISFMAKMKEAIENIRQGIMSLKDVDNKWLFSIYTIAIWLSYFLHYWITFLCFDFTSVLGFNAAIVSFIIGSISVIVPTPNGAGPWHFSVKTILVLYGIADLDAISFVLIVHTLQTALVPALGALSLICLAGKNVKEKM